MLEVREARTATPEKTGKLIEQLKKELDADYPPPHVKRHAHPKMHGCVQATLRVDADVAPDLRHGVFTEPGREYRAWVRFSNAFGLQHDLKFQGRGMAIKLLDVAGADGEWLCPPGEMEPLEQRTQDFVMGTHDVFVLPDDRFDYREFAAAARSGFLALVRVFWRHRLLRGFIALVRGGSVLARNPLDVPYFSQTPYRLGPGHTIKFHARPRPTPTLAQALPGRLRFRLKSILVTLVIELSARQTAAWLVRVVGFAGGRDEGEGFCHRFFASRNYLRESLTAFLARADAQFEIMVQLQTDERRMPANDATVRWSERLSPYRRVAVLTIPRQVASPTAGLPRAVKEAAIDVMDRGENMAFSPWHGLTAHAPLGEINEVRGHVYSQMSRFRREERNRITPPDPYADYDRFRTILQAGALEESRAAE